MPVKSSLLGVGFERNVLIFKAGENINGSVNFSGGTRGKTLYDVKLSLIRRTDYVFWTDQTRKGKATSLSHMLATINSQSVASVGLHKGDSEAIYLPPDVTTCVQFSLPLPPTLWSSFVVLNAFTWYGLMFSAREGTPYSAKESFILKRDVVLIGNVSIPTEPSLTTAFKKVVSAHDNRMRLSLKKSWAAAGEHLPFRVEVFGETLSTNVSLNLQQNISYNFACRCRMKTKSTEANIVWKDEGQLDAKEGKKEYRGHIEVPYVVPTGLGAETCPNLNVHYMFQVVVPRSGLALKTEIHIGTTMDDEKSELGAGNSNADSISLAYGLEMSRSLSGSSYSLDWDAQSLSSEDSGCWSLLEESG